jgi:hypothetical protein
LPAFDVHAPLLSLPGFFQTTLDNIPAEVPYLFVDEALVERWRAELARIPGYKVGIAWQGSRGYSRDMQRSLPLACFEALARVAGVSLVSLQKGPGAEQVAALGGRFPVVDLGGRLDQEAGAFMDTAAVLKNLDLVVTSDTALPHLAGGLGVPAWVALPFAPDWRWLLGRGDSPWYPSLRLFRQPRPGDWGAVFHGMAGELRQRLGKAPDRRSVEAAIAPGELIDKITILEIKMERIADADKLGNVRRELTVLEAARDRHVAASEALSALTADLKAANGTLWEVEDALRECERQKDFGPRFVELARTVYRTNDLRAALKRRINELLGSRLVEEKSYADYA